MIIQIELCLILLQFSSSAAILVRDTNIQYNSAKLFYCLKRIENGIFFTYYISYGHFIIFLE